MQANKNAAAIYVRVSTKKESQKDSPEHQRMVCEEKAIMDNLDVHYVYEDRESGTSIVGRSEIQRLVRDAQKGCFRTIIFASLSRFSRDLLDSVALKRMLVDALGLRLISLDENYDSQYDHDELKFQIISSVNQKLSESIAISSRRGKRQSAKNGNFTGNRAPYGYDKMNITIPGKERKTLRPNDHAETVKLIFTLYVLRKLGEKRIVRILNEEMKIPAPNGGRWGLSSIQRILQNEAYIGRHVFSKFTTTKVYNDLRNMHDRKYKLVKREKSKWERAAEAQWEAIIDEEIFQKAQEIRLKRGGGRRGGARAKVNLFAGLLYCAHCGSSMCTVKSQSSSAHPYRYLTCSRRRRQGETGCSNRLWLPYEEFKQAILQEISSLLKKHIDVERLAQERSATPLRINKLDHEKDKKKLHKVINDNRKFMFEIRKQRMAGALNEEQFVFEMGQYESEIKAALDKLLKLSGEPGGEEHDEEPLQSAIKNALAQLVDLQFDSMDELRLTIAKLVHKITVDSQVNVMIYASYMLQTPSPTRWGLKHKVILQRAT